MKLVAQAAHLMGDKVPGGGESCFQPEGQHHSHTHRKFLSKNVLKDISGVVFYSAPGHFSTQPSWQSGPSINHTNGATLSDI